MDTFENLERQEVLRLCATDKMKYLSRLRVRHARLESVAKDVMALLDPYNEVSILAVIGATGVGKTTLLKELIRSLLKKVLASSEDGASDVPFLFLTAPANGHRSVSWSTIYQKALASGGEVLIDRKLETTQKEEFLRVVPRRYKDVGALRDALLSMLKNRGVRVVVIDEAYHLLRYGNYAVVMDTLKSLADDSGVKLVLLGSYDLFDLATDYGQVARRAEIVHFERYHLEDMKEFKDIVRRVQICWPCEEVPNFVAIVDDLMEATLGCVGLLKALFLQALSLQLDNKQIWDPRFLARAGKSVKLLDRIRREIQEGEEKVQGATYGQSIFAGAVLSRTIAKMGKKVAA